MPDAAQSGRVIIYTGDGKGKTTAALGTALRAVGQGIAAGVVQFVKARPCGEHAAAGRLAPDLTIRRMGAGWVTGGPPTPTARPPARPWPRSAACLPRAGPSWSSPTRF